MNTGPRGAADPTCQAPQSTVTKMAARSQGEGQHQRTGCRTCFEARKHREGKPDLVARFGGITLRQDRRAVILTPPRSRSPYPRKELIRRLRKRRCELCEHGTTVAVHQVAGLKAASASRDRASPRGPPSWRKCGARRSSSARACHDWIHANPVAHAA